MIIRRYHPAFFLAFHEGREAFRDLDGSPDHGFHCVLELRRVGCFAEDSGLSRQQLFVQGAVAAGTMGIQDVSVLFVASCHSFFDLCVFIGRAADLLPDGLPRLVVEIVDSGEIARRSYVHCIGYGLDAGLWFVPTILQEFEEHVIGIVGCDKSFHRQSHFLTEESGADIAEVAAWCADDEVGVFGIQRCHSMCLPDSSDLRCSMEIIECLRQEAGHVDRIGTREFHVSVQLRIHEGILDQCLTVVEYTVYLNRSDVPAERGELTFLYLADLPFGVEDIYADAIHAEETVGNGRAGVAGGCYEHVDLLLSAAFLSDKVLQQACHEARAYILEGERRTVEEFQCVDVVFDRDDGTVERKCVRHDLFQCSRFHIFAEEGFRNLQGDLLECVFWEVIIERLGERRDARGHVKAPVGCQSLDHCLVQRSQRRFLVG